MTAPAKITSKAEVRERVTAAEAQAKFLVPPGHVWNEEEQRAIPRGDAMELARLEQPLDLATQLAGWKRNRDTLVRFVQEYLEEASYDQKGYPIPGQVRDFYKVPGSETKALTKRGGEKLATLFRFGKASTSIVAHTETKEYVSATVEVALVDQYRRPVGSAVSSCSTAEGGFASERARKKYQGDYRAALNDVVARAAKRAFVQAVIVAAAADEMFTGTAADEGEAAGEQAPARPRPRFPASWREVGGKLIEDATDEQLHKVAEWCRRARNPQAAAPLLDAVTEEQERRRIAREGEADDQPHF